MKASTPDRFDLPKGSRFGEAHDQIADYLENSKARTLPAESVKLDKPAQLALLCAHRRQDNFGGPHKNS